MTSSLRGRPRPRLPLRAYLVVLVVVCVVPMVVFSVWLAVVLAAPVATLGRPWMRSLGAVVVGGAAFLLMGVALATLACRPITRSRTRLTETARARSPALRHRQPGYRGDRPDRSRGPEDLLDASRIVSGRFRLAIERVDLAGIIEPAIEAVRAAARNKAIVLTSALDPATGAVLGDSTRLQQVVWNLLSNAVRFTPAGGRVTVGLKRLGPEAELTVTDTGRGMAPGLLPRVFDRFRQGESGTMRSHGGLGLGLSIARQIVELHGGTIRADSPGEGRGATFTVCLPLAAVQAVRPGPAAPRARPNGPDRAPTRRLENIDVLVVDDDAETREVLKVVLGFEGAQVTTAPSVADAVAAIERRWPDVLVSDIGMPGEDGYDLIRRVRRLEVVHGRHLPAIALTAYTGAEDRRRTLHAGYDTHVAKPVEASAFAPLIASLLPRERGA